MRPHAAALLAPAALGACVETQMEPTAEFGAIAFQQDCAACHGTDARGAGSFGAELLEQPPDLTTLAARNGGVFPRDEVMSAIDGFSRGTHFSAAMPEFGAGDMGEIILVEGEGGISTPIPVRLLALAEYLDSIQQ